MSVAGKLSPTSNLLRGSRLFAVPKPLSSSLTNASSRPAAHSDTATSPYPTHAAIETTPDARSRGEWGLKRSLPLKSTTKTGTNYIRVKEGIDTIEHITNFESAADHVVTLKKFQSLNVPVLLPHDTRGRAYPGGLESTPFEEKFHSTEDLKTSLKEQKRWKMEGPWIAGMSNSEFDWWLKGGVLHPGIARKKNIFQKFLQKKMITDMVEAELQRYETAWATIQSADATADQENETAFPTLEQHIRDSLSRGDLVKDIHNRISQLIADGAARLSVFQLYVQELLAQGHGVEDIATQVNATIGSTESKDIQDHIEKLFREHLRSLRAQPAKLLPLIQTFYDLPDTPRNASEWKFGGDDAHAPTPLASRAYRDMGMPSTHPSAGLGYLRMGAYLQNHPIYGPQSQPDPVQARVLKHGSSNRMDWGSRSAKLGIAGFVTDIYQEGRLPAENAALREFMPQDGGLKYPIRPTHVSITPDGRPIMEARATQTAKLVMSGLSKEMDAEEYLAKRKTDFQPFNKQMPRLDGNYLSQQKDQARRNSELASKSRKALGAMISARQEQEKKENDMLNNMMPRLGR